MDPVPGALEAVDRLKEKYDLYILSSSPWENPAALGDKLAVKVKKYFLVAMVRKIFSFVKLYFHLLST